MKLIITRDTYIKGQSAKVGTVHDVAGTDNRGRPNGDAAILLLQKQAEVFDPAKHKTAKAAS